MVHRIRIFWTLILVFGLVLTGAIIVDNSGALACYRCNREPQHARCEAGFASGATDCTPTVRAGADGKPWDDCDMRGNCFLWGISINIGISKNMSDSENLDSQTGPGGELYPLVWVCMDPYLADEVGGNTSLEP